MVLLAIASGLFFRIATSYAAREHLKVGEFIIGLWNGNLLHRYLCASRPSSWNLEDLSDAQFSALIFLLVDLLNVQEVSRMVCLMLGCSLSFLISDIGPDVWQELVGGEVVRYRDTPPSRSSSISRASSRRSLRRLQRRLRLEELNSIQDTEHLSAVSSTYGTPRSTTIRSVTWEDQLPSSSRSTNVNYITESSVTQDGEEVAPYSEVNGSDGSDTEETVTEGTVVARLHPDHSRPNYLARPLMLREAVVTNEYPPDTVLGTEEPMIALQDDQPPLRDAPATLPEVDLNSSTQSISPIPSIYVTPTGADSIPEPEEEPPNHAMEPAELKPPSLSRTPLGVMDYQSVATPPESVITDVPKDARLASAERLRLRARAAEAEAHAYEKQRVEAVKEGRPDDAFRLKFLRDDAREMANNLDRRAARRYLEAHNLRQTIDTLDVHGLRPAEALKRTEKKLREMQVLGSRRLRVIVGQGRHSRAKRPILRPFLLDQMRLQKIPCSVDPRNPGVLIISLH